MQFLVLALAMALVCGSRRWRVLVPCWRFFSEAGPGHRLELRRTDSPWQAFRPPLRRHLLLNPQNTLGLAQLDLVHALTADLERLEAGPQPKVEDWVSYQLVAGLTRQLGGSRFRICSGNDEVFRSPWL